MSIILLWALIPYSLIASCVIVCFVTAAEYKQNGPHGGIVAAAVSAVACVFVYIVSISCVAALIAQVGL